MLCNTDVTIFQLLHYMDNIIQSHPDKCSIEKIDAKVVQTKKLDECEMFYDLCDQGKNAVKSIYFKIYIKSETFIKKFIKKFH